MMEREVDLEYRKARVAIRQDQALFRIQLLFQSNQVAKRVRYALGKPRLILPNLVDRVFEPPPEMKWLLPLRQTMAERGVCVQQKLARSRAILDSRPREQAVGWRTK